MSKSLAVTYRPTTFDEVCSQESIIRILKRIIESGDIKNAYLFAGASGCGKTTCARIFANEINGHLGSPIEVDAASIIKKDASGAQVVRDTIITPSKERSIDSTYKVYIIDECQAFSSQAWQAFLKCIEEPPKYTIFIFCSTDPQKIPDTILNRVMRFNFTRIDSNTIKSRLEYICKEEGFTNYSESCSYISKICHGGMRDAISILEKVASYDTNIDIQNVMKVVGGISYDIMFSLLNNLIDGNEVNVLSLIDKIYTDGNDLRLFVDQFLSFCLDISKYIIFNNLYTTSIPAFMENSVKNTINFNDAKKYYSYLVNKVMECKNAIKSDTTVKTTIEVYFLNIARCM